MDERRWNYFAKLVYESGRLRESGESNAVIIAGDRPNIILTIGSEILDGFYEYPVFEALKEYFRIEPNLGDPQSITVFCSYFPHVDEVKMLIQSPLRNLCFWGDLDDEETVKFINDHSKKYMSSGLQITNLKK